MRSAEGNAGHSVCLHRDAHRPPPASAQRSQLAALHLPSNHCRNQNIHLPLVECFPLGQSGLGPRIPLRVSSPPPPPPLPQSALRGDERGAKRHQVVRKECETGMWPALLLGAGAFLLGVCLGASSSSSHSLRYFYTGMSEPDQGLPWFIAVGYVDDQLFVQYDSNTRRARPRAPWIQEKENAEYWNRETWNFQRFEPGSKASLVTVAKSYNHSGGLHTWQGLYGCEMRADGSRGGYRRYSYDGRDYLSLDKESLTWTPADAQAEICKRKLDAWSVDNRYWKSYLEEECFEQLQRFLDHGKEALMRKEPPVVKVTRQVEHDGTETLVCRAHGFHPKALEATWRKDGEVLEHETFRRDVAPNSDGTYHAWLSIQIYPKDRGRYRCQVEHDGLLEPLDVAWEEPGASNLGLLIGGVVGAFVVLLVALIIGIYFYKKQQSGYKAASTGDQNLEISRETGSDSSL